MSSESFNDRAAENVPGRFYVGNWCTDCDFCRATAPANFGRICRSRERGGFSYVMKQPTSPEEEAACMEAMEHCCVRAIFADGEEFDWTKRPVPVADDPGPEGPRPPQAAQVDGGGCRCRTSQDPEGQRPS